MEGFFNVLHLLNNVILKYQVHWLFTYSYRVKSQNGKLFKHSSYLKCLNVILFKGALRINPKKYKEAFVPSPVSILYFTFTHTTFTV